jgi:hypothetical protein
MLCEERCSSGVKSDDVRSDSPVALRPRVKCFCTLLKKSTLLCRVFIGIIYWHYLLALFIGIIYWHYLLALFIGIYWHYYLLQGYRCTSQSLIRLRQDLKQCHFLLRNGIFGQFNRHSVARNHGSGKRLVACHIIRPRFGRVHGR